MCGQHSVEKVAHSSVALDGTSTYQCICTVGWTGPDCSIAILAPIVVSLPLNPPQNVSNQDAFIIASNIANFVNIPPIYVTYVSKSTVKITYSISTPSNDPLIYSSIIRKLKTTNTLVLRFVTRDGAQPLRSVFTTGTNITSSGLDIQSASPSSSPTSSPSPSVDVVLIVGVTSAASIVVGALVSGVILVYVRSRKKKNGQNVQNGE